LPRLLWLPILYGFVLPFRPRRSARKYRRIWSQSGAPLLALSQHMRTELIGTLAQRMLAPLSIELAMLYGTDPSVPQALARLRESGAQRILVVPLFPQYCGATTGAVYDRVNAELRYVAEYHDYPGYIDALRATVTQQWQTQGKTQHLLISFHGIPERYFHKGDPYFCKCQKTARLLADELMLKDNEWSVSFQSRFGPDGWLKPYTSKVLEEMPARGIRQVTVICPGFAIDCLETLEEIEMENRDRFLAAGGEQFQYVPSLNARPEHARFLADLIARHCQGWTHVELGLRPAGAARGASA
jgi:ferrochelatase